jgi:hypothetical protein
MKFSESRRLTIDDAIAALPTFDVDDPLSNAAFDSASHLPEDYRRAHRQCYCDIDDEQNKANNTTDLPLDAESRKGQGVRSGNRILFVCCRLSQRQLTQLCCGALLPITALG